MTLQSIILQIISDPDSFGSYIGIGSGIGATAGSIATMAVQKIFNKKKDKADIDVINYDVIDKQFKSLWENLEHQGEVIKELQSKACYRDPCGIRINGNETTIPTKKKKAL